MKFKATPEQLAILAANAVNAAVAVGMGLLHATDRVFTPEEMIRFIGKDEGMNLDYVQGRMTKLYIRREAEGIYSMRDDLNIEYQSWTSRYPTVQEFLESVPGIQRYPEQNRQMDV